MEPMLDDTLEVERAIRRFDISAPFWEATRDRRLLLQRCKVSGRYQHYPRPVSLVTGRSTDLEWCEVSGRGAVFSYTVVRRARPPFRGHEPYAEVSVRLDEGVNVIANLVGCRLDEVEIGMRVEPQWHPLEDGTHLLMFRPDRGDATDRIG